MVTHPLSARDLAKSGDTLRRGLHRQNTNHPRSINSSSRSNSSATMLTWATRRRRLAPLSASRQKVAAMTRVTGAEPSLLVMRLARRRDQPRIVSEAKRALTLLWTAQRLTARSWRRLRALLACLACFQVRVTPSSVTAP
jgi:hypothetical protein